MAAYLLCGESFVWKIYPVITHLPIILLLCLHFCRRFVTAIAATMTAYMCCQPAKWIGLLVQTFTESYVVEYLIRIVVLMAVGFLVDQFMARPVSDIYSKDSRSVWIFGIVPIVYYLFDYSTTTYATFLGNHSVLVAEFLPFFLCVIHLIFCVVYYREYEQKADAERNEQILRITTEQQSREVETIRRSSHEIRLLRHDMRLFLNTLLLCIEEDDKQTARKMISGYADMVDKTVLQYYCQNETINYVLSDFAERCRSNGISFQLTIEPDVDPPNEILFVTILANTLDNALNAQKELPKSKRCIKLMLKNSDGKLLLAVKNPFWKRPVIVDGMLVSEKKGHGYGTQSIRYMTEHLGGKCLFSIKDDQFIVQVVI